MQDNQKDIYIAPADFSSLEFYDNLFQSGFWGFFKARIENDAKAFKVSYRGKKFPLIIIQRRIDKNNIYIYAPRAPQLWLPESEQGPFLENLSSKLLPYISSEAVFIRYDTRWFTPYNDEDFYNERGQWVGPPRKRIREIRMNYFTSNKTLRKSSVDLLPPDTIHIDLTKDEENILSRMRQNTRNCIRRALRKGVVIRDAPLSRLPDWYNLYADTAERKGFPRINYDYFHFLFHYSYTYKNYVDDKSLAPEFRLLLAMSGEDLLAGIILGLYGKTAYYLYAGSSGEKRDYMPNYLLQWEAIKTARKSGCLKYDLFGIPPNNSPDHEQHGLYTFKTGFGGRIIHQRGCWDYPLNEELYMLTQSAEVVK